MKALLDEQMSLLRSCGRNIKYMCKNMLIKQNCLLRKVITGLLLLNTYLLFKCKWRSTVIYKCLLNDYTVMETLRKCSQIKYNAAFLKLNASWFDVYDLILLNNWIFHGNIFINLLFIARKLIAKSLQLFIALQVSLNCFIITTRD